MKLSRNRKGIRCHSCREVFQAGKAFKAHKSYCSQKWQPKMDEKSRSLSPHHGQEI